MTKEQKGKALTITLISIGVLTLIGGIVLGVKALGGTKKTNGGSNPILPNNSNATTTTNTPPPSANSNNTGSSSFPLRKGSRNQYVTELQQDLQGLGQDITTDGIFGSQTESALISVTGKSTVDSPAELEAIRMRQYPVSTDTSSWSSAFDFSKFSLS